ncbi:hypothetical protein BD626DRAFT_407694 [Schizophyllum amplum]|uniref:DUF1275 domain protein n=1 Tax=Schizophyllum amplum TaxID=97359 RepID=A0A550C6A8_9AGAR|nr:hypothetical protein BD626DRAFT_407694 [Auriculariopsis ampla]
MSRTTSEDPTLTNVPRRRFLPATSFLELWRGDVDTTRCATQMNVFYFMSGFMNAIHFPPSLYGVAFQSGNTAQLAIAIARLWEGHTKAFLMADKQALTSLLTFVLGGLFARLFERMGPRSRGWLWLGTMLQALLTMAAGVAGWKSNQGYPGISDDRFQAGPAWDDAVSFICLGFISASMGLQGIQAISVAVPLTTTWCELVASRVYFAYTNGIRPETNGRLVFNVLHDRFYLSAGALMARGLVFRIGSPGALGVGVGIRILTAFSFSSSPGRADAADGRHRETICAGVTQSRCHKCARCRKDCLVFRSCRDVSVEQRRQVYNQISCTCIYTRGLYHGRYVHGPK